MKIAISADFHLTSNEKNPERFSTLKNILKQLEEEEIETLIIAGDLFDNENPSYPDFESIIEKSKIKIFVIPGNHDSNLEQKFFISKNLKIVNNPEIIELDGKKFLFIPYSELTDIGIVLEKFSSELEERKWILISHCDFMKGKREINIFEKGIYMPLTSKELNRYQPNCSFIGHIHKASDVDDVHIPGSPCGLDITESGYRRFLIYNTQNDYVEECSIEPSILFFDITLFCLPSSNELEVFQKKLEESIIALKLRTSKDKEIANIRVVVKGFTSDRSAIEEVVRDGFKGFRYFKNEGPDLSNLKNVNENEKIEIAQLVEKRIRDIQIPESLDYVGKDEICFEMMKIIFGV